MIAVFVPSRGFLFFYHTQAIITRFEILFSSPHGDFSFSMVKGYYVPYGYMGFRPLTGISLFLFGLVKTLVRNTELFSSPHGDFSFSIKRKYNAESISRQFSSPHGDFSFSIETCYTSKFEKPFSSPHGDFSFSITTR